MNPELHTYELIDRYFRNELKGEELAQFNLKIASDSTFAELVEAQKIANELIIDEQMIALKERMTQDLKSDGNTGQPWGKVILGAVIIITAAAGTYYYSSKNNETTNSLRRNLNSTIKETPASPEKNVLPEKTKVFKKKDHPVQIKTIPVIDLPKDERPVKDIQRDFFYDPSLPQIVPGKTTVHGNKTSVNCSSVKITAHLTVTNTCEDHATGSVTIDLNSIEGGASPYTFSVNGDNFSPQYTFSYLQEGNYHIIIKDDNNCVSIIQEAQVKKESCHKLIDDAFMPAQGETWKFPADSDNAEISIFNKTGKEVYHVKMNRRYPESWDGKDNSGADLEAGVYYFNIKHDNGQNVQGHISIIR
ncbi:MAG: gliding motility-associated C-terminal domain-containing protein [Cytophagaceae bacterium]|nr:gliding motility-associated C-terminal domain-containing protein [Cytophagaceae bacterium]